MERFTRTISVSLDLLEAAPGLDPQRRVPGRVGPTARQARSVPADQLGGSDRRWLVFTGKKGGDEVGRCPKGNGTRILLMVDAEGTPLSAYTTAAHHNEVNTVETLVKRRQLCYQTPRRLLYDKAADADWLRERLAGRGIELICPHRANRRKPSRQDGRALRRYIRRYRVERSISWLHRFRRLITRWEYYSDLFQGFVHLACLFTIINRL
jgi:transposase